MLPHLMNHPNLPKKSFQLSLRRARITKILTKYTLMIKSD